jgi:hypothetical protein
MLGTASTPLPRWLPLTTVGAMTLPGNRRSFLAGFRQPLGAIPPDHLNSPPLNYSAPVACQLPAHPSSHTSLLWRSEPGWCSDPLENWTTTLVQGELVRERRKTMSKRRMFTPDFKAHVVLEELIGAKDKAEICREYSLRSQVSSRWREEFPERVPGIFAIKPGRDDE